MNNTFISVYLRYNRIHVYVDSLRGIGSPSRVCFLFNPEKNRLLMVPYEKLDFKSHRVPAVSYKGKGGVEIFSIRLCRALADINDWDLRYSYRIPGKIYPDQRVVAYSLREAQRILFRV